MKLFAALVFIWTSILCAQIGYVEVNDEIYSFLERMQTHGIIKDYDSFEIPKSRTDIVKYLKAVIASKNKLDIIDKKKLSVFQKEFELELTGEIFNALNTIPVVKNIFSDQEKYIYSFVNEDVSLLVNFIGSVNYLHSSNIEESKNRNTTLYKFGGKIRGSLYNNFGFEVSSTNGSFIGSKSLAQNYSSLRYNYKFNQKNIDNTGDDYFDETEAFISYQNNYMKVKLGNDRRLIGNGPHKIILSDNAPRMDYLSLDLAYKKIKLSFFHGKLLGEISETFDKEQGDINKVSDKYLAYHRLNLNLSKHFNFSVGEMLIYANRNIDFAYLNPFNFYKSAEHSNQDRDNSFLFFDIKNQTFKDLKIYSTLIIDDIDFGKIGSGWYGNQTLWNVGVYSTQLYRIIPLDFEVSYIRIDPYVFSHRIHENNYTSLGYALGSDYQPNSSTIEVYAHYRPHYKVNVSLRYAYSVHGKNKTDNSGFVIDNVGGDILVGHRPSDREEIYFLEGVKQYSQIYQLNLLYEPIKDWIFNFNILFNNQLPASQHSKNLFSTLSLQLKF